MREIHGAHVEMYQAWKLFLRNHASKAHYYIIDSAEGSRSEQEAA
jgi:hypothetical protein